MVLWFIFSCFMFLKVYQMRSFFIIFSSWLLLLQKKATDFLIFISYVMTLLNPHLFQYFFQLILTGFLRNYFPKIVIFFFLPFPIGKGHTPHFCSGSHYIGFNFQNNVKSQTQFWSPNFKAPLSPPPLLNILTLPGISARLSLVSSNISWCLGNSPALTPGTSSTTPSNYAS